LGCPGGKKVKRARRSRILIDGSGELLKRISQDIEEHYSIKTVDPPEEGTVMVKMKDAAQNTPFYLGEVLITETRVLVEGALGLGIIKGHHPKKAYRLALIDGAFRKNLDRKDLWISWLEEEERVVEAQKELFQARMSRTKVDFSTMEDQGVES